MAFAIKVAALLLTTTALSGPAWGQTNTDATDTTPPSRVADEVPVASTPADPAAAGEPNTDPASASGNSEIIVTGSNVIRNGYQAPTPVTAVTTEQLVSVSPSRLGDALTQLPQFRGSPSPRTTYQATLGLGGANLSLRNLGSNRTLVLLDGRRIAPTSTRGDYDTDVLPQGLVTRVDVVTGGASAQYGSDAVGGVVNFILDKRFEGVKGAVQKGISTYGDGATFRVDLSGGFGFSEDRGHLIASYTHTEFSEIPAQDSRPWGRSYRGLVTITGAPVQQFFDNVGQPASYGGAITAGPLSGTQFGPGGTVLPYALGNPRTASATVNSDGTHLIQPVTSGLNGEVAYAHINYEFSEAFTLFAEGSYANNHVRFQQGYPNYQFGTTAFTIYSGNPFLPAEIQSRLTATNTASFQLQRVSRDLGVTIADIDNENYSLSAGFDGTVGTVSYGAYATFGENSGDYVIVNNLDTQRLYAAADAVRDPTTGNTVCRVTLTNPGLYPGCVPINLFGEGSPSPEAANYVKRDLPYSPRIRQSSVHGYLRAEPFSTWAGPVAVAIGADYRKQDLLQTTDPLSATIIRGTGIRGFPSAVANRTGGFTTLNPQGASGSLNVWEVSGEALLPLAKDVSWARSLDLNGAVRYTDYSTSGGVTTWKLGATYAPVDDIRFRGTYSRDIRAPNLGELFLAGISAQTGINDPQQGGRSYIIFSRGIPSPNLLPEEGETYAVGVVLTPGFLPGFSASIDYFNIKVGGIISALTQQQTIDACQGGSAFNCSLIRRDPGTNDIVNIDLPSQNLSSLKTDGIDVDVSYSTQVGPGTLRLRAVGSYVPTFTLQVPGAAAINYAGEIGVRATGTTNQSNPKFAGNLTVTYDTESFGLTVQERFIGKGTYDVTRVEGVTISDNSIPAVAYTDVTAKALIDGLGGKQELFLTVNNLFNKAPPLFPTGSPILPSLYNRNLYDGIGRFFTAGFRFRF